MKQTEQTESKEAADENVGPSMHGRHAQLQARSHGQIHARRFAQRELRQQHFQSSGRHLIPERKGCEVAKLQGYTVARLQGCKVAKFASAF
jgi:hypothetical protein